MRSDKTSRVIRRHFDSLPQMADFAQNGPRTWSTHSSEKEGNGDSWDLSAGYAGAVAMARDGWSEGAQKLQRALKAFAPRSPVPALAYGVAGFRPSVPRYIAGNPRCMIRHTATPDSGRGRVLTLIVPVSANWNVSARNMSFFGIGVAQYVRQLEAQGTRVHLIACVTAQIYNTRVTHSWTVKNPDQGLDLASVAFSIGHPACFRRLGFALLERSEAQEISNYGVSIDTRVSDILNAPANAFVLNGMKDANENAVTPADALAFVERQITEALEKAA